MLTTMKTAVVELVAQREIISNVAHEQDPRRRISNKEASLQISVTCQLSL
jgi:hypothetical protein